MATDVQNQWIMRVFGIDVAAPGAATAPPDAATADTATGDTLFLDERLAGIVADVKLYAAAQLSGPVREAATAIKAGRPDAATLVEALEDQLVEIGAAFRRAEAQLEVAKGGMGKASVVAFAKTRLRWESAQRAVADATANVGDGFRALLETDEFQDDPRTHESDTPGLIDALAAQLPQIETLAGAIDDALDMTASTPEEQQRRIDAALKAIATYEARLANFNDLREFESTPAGTYPTVSLIETSLAELKGALSVAADSLDEETDERTAA